MHMQLAAPLAVTSEDGKRALLAHGVLQGQFARGDAYNIYAGTILSDTSFKIYHRS